MLRRVVLACLSIALLQAACGGSGTSPSLDVPAQDYVVSQDPGQLDTSVVEDLNRTDLAQNDTTQPDVPLSQDLVATDTVVTDTPPTDPGVEDPGLADVAADLGVDTVPVEDTAPVDTTPADVTLEDTAPEADAVPECTEDADCQAKGDPSICHLFACQSGACVEVAAEDGSSCTDGDFCTAPDTCKAGKCVAGTAVTCDDGDPCTADSCANGACLNVPDTTVLSCGTGDCYRETPRCSNGVIHTCVAGTPTPETCDGRDNDCDGTTDNGNLGGGKACDSGLPGPCAAGTMVCRGGSLVCVQNTLPAPEVCDGIDNNCDGTVDEGNPNGGLRCPTGKLGVCSIGATACINGLVACVQTVEPTLEICDGIDNNCDGLIDEGNPGSGLSCSTGKPGVCDQGVTSCVDGKIACIQVGQPGPEVCDGVDNDCDGVVDPAGATGCLPFNRDVDGDGYGVAGDVQCLCAPAAPYRLSSFSTSSSSWSENVRSFMG